MHNFDFEKHNYTPSDLKIFKPCFSVNEMDTMGRYLSRPKWRYGHISSPKHQTPPFWSMSLIDLPFFMEDLLNKIQELTGDELVCTTCYANGATYGLSGQPHQDAFNEYGRTFLLYANTAWDVRWNGKTTFLFDDGPQFVTPELNKAVYFPGLIPHFSEETTRTFGGLRKTVAWKLKLK
tara:strand:+ start:266 stop:802 length:537 start_codon:yes stop_codon:yes gene_type:complete